MRASMYVCAYNITHTYAMYILLIILVNNYDNQEAPCLKQETIKCSEMSHKNQRNTK